MGFRDKPTRSGNAHDGGNCRTVVVRLDRPTAALAPRAAHAALYPSMAELARRGEAGYVVGAVRANGHLVGPELARCSSAITIGRHTQCGLVLTDESIALRALTALVTTDEAGSAILRLWDLATDAPFHGEDGQPTTALVADGWVYIVVGPYALWFLPAVPGTWPASAADAWAARPATAFLDRRAPASVPSSAPVFLPRPREAGRTTHVTRVAPALYVGEDCAPELAWGSITVQQGHRRSRCAISAEQLERGVLLGRYERCRLNAVGDDGISRVHLMLVRIGAEVWAIDAASTNGVLRGDDGELHAAVLADGNVLSLTGSTSVVWRRVVGAVG